MAGMVPVCSVSAQRELDVAPGDMCDCGARKETEWGTLLLHMGGPRLDCPRRSGCTLGETSEDASGARPGSVHFFKFYRARRVRDAAADVSP
eukprot:gene23636-biopygen5839